jgi:hypothetical protein
MTDHTDKTDPEGEWTRHYGGKPPAQLESLEVRLRNGHEMTAVGADLTDDRAWAHIWGQSDIIAYRLITPQRALDLLDHTDKTALAEGIEEAAQNLGWFIGRARKDGFHAWADRLDKYRAALQAGSADPVGRVGEVLDAASAYLQEQYGLAALSNPVDRSRILAALSPSPVEKLVEALERISAMTPAAANARGAWALHAIKAIADDALAEIAINKATSQHKEQDQ